MVQNGGALIDVTSTILLMFEIIILPVIAFTLGWLVRRIQRQRKFQAFLQVFGQVAKTSQNILISLPLWKLKEASRDITRFHKLGFDGTAEEYYGPDDQIAFDDLEASAQVSSILAEFFPSPINYSLDNEKELDATGKTIFLLGSPQANTRTRRILRHANQPYFEFIDLAETEDHPSRIAIRDKTDNTVYDSTGTWHYSVVLRVPKDEMPTSYFFIISGDHPMGTLAAATYLKKHWEDFKEANPTAGVLLQMPRSDIAHYLVVKKLGFLNNREPSS